MVALAHKIIMSESRWSFEADHFQRPIALLWHRVRDRAEEKRERARARRDSERVEREAQVRRREARRKAWPWVRARLVVEAVKAGTDWEVCRPGPYEP